MATTAKKKSQNKKAPARENMGIAEFWKALEVIDEKGFRCEIQLAYEEEDGVWVLDSQGTYVRALQESVARIVAAKINEHRGLSFKGEILLIRSWQCRRCAA